LVYAMHAQYDSNRVAPGRIGFPTTV
jgi:hypothetical protein